MNACSPTLRLILLLFLTVATQARGEQIIVLDKDIVYPDEIFQTTGQPLVALFKRPKPHAFALGCINLLRFWSKALPAIYVEPSRWSEIEPYVVGDIFCSMPDGPTRKVTTVDAPDALLVVHRKKEANGNKIICRHHVDSPAWFDVIEGQPDTAIERQLAFDYPNRGIDFNSDRRITDPPKYISDLCLTK